MLSEPSPNEVNTSEIAGSEIGFPREAETHFPKGPFNEPSFFSGHANQHFP